tara:strand:+ start:1012 stop:1347 length:336 start_codon:yes stop_codon:yes gene_type:complete
MYRLLSYLNKKLDKFVWIAIYFFFRKKIIKRRFNVLVNLFGANLEDYGLDVLGIMFFLVHSYKFKNKLILTNKINREVYKECNFMVRNLAVFLLLMGIFSSVAMSVIIGFD